jgi:hypothetical protein
MDHGTGQGKVGPCSWLSFHEDVWVARGMAGA